MTRASITNARNRSINTILKSQTRSKQYCMFFNKFGKCNKREKGVCPYIHDREKVAVCRKFLASNCYNERCLLSHKVPDKLTIELWLGEQMVLVTILVMPRIRGSRLQSGPELQMN